MSTLRDRAGDQFQKSKSVGYERCQLRAVRRGVQVRVDAIRPRYSRALMRCPVSVVRLGLRLSGGWSTKMRSGPLTGALCFTRQQKEVRHHQYHGKMGIGDDGSL